jgi:hypothetical protein
VSCGGPLSSNLRWGGPGPHASGTGAPTALAHKRARTSLRMCTRVHTQGLFGGRSTGTLGLTMGRHIVRVPKGFAHPTDAEGYYIPGAHHEALYLAGAGACTAYQIYEDTSDGTPVSPIFESLSDLVAWLEARGISPEAAKAFAAQGFAPLLVLSESGAVEDGMEGMKSLGRE